MHATLVNARFDGSRSNQPYPCKQRDCFCSLISRHLVIVVSNLNIISLIVALMHMLLRDPDWMSKLKFEMNLTFQKDKYIRKELSLFSPPQPTVNERYCFVLHPNTFHTICLEFHICWLWLMQLSHMCHASSTSSPRQYSSNALW